MNASKRTKKQNAYLTGIGKSRRLVLYDTILNYPEEEILAIIGHELGHNTKKHIPKLLITSSIFYTFMFYLTNVVYNFIKNQHIFGVRKAYSLFIHAFLFITSILYFVTSIFNYIQRKFEYKADKCSLKLHGIISILYPRKGFKNYLIKENKSILFNNFSKLSYFKVSTAALSNLSYDLVPDSYNL